MTHCPWRAEKWPSLNRTAEVVLQLKDFISLHVMEYLKVKAGVKNSLPEAMCAFLHTCLRLLSLRLIRPVWLSRLHSCEIIWFGVGRHSYLRLFSVMLQTRCSSVFGCTKQTFLPLLRCFTPDNSSAFTWSLWTFYSLCSGLKLNCFGHPGVRSARKVCTTLGLSRFKTTSCGWMACPYLSR